jgi:serine/threonine protein kinase
VSTAGIPKRYAILERLAVGGMGEVFLARQVGVGGFQRAVVLKRMLADAEGDDDAMRRMLDEARIIGALSHENVVTIIEVGDDTSSPYFALEYVHGENAGVLRSRAAKRGEVLSPLVASTIVLDAAKGLQHAHTAVGLDGKPMNIIHRDIAPKNLFVREDGLTKVGDFGIARADDRLSHTETGAVAGTLSYMSPEQLQNLPLTPLSDQFALGIVLWELVTGRRLFKGDGPVETASKIITGVVPLPSSFVPDMDPDLEKVCMRMLAGQPHARFSSMQGVVDALERVMPEAAGQVGRKAVAKFVEAMAGIELRERRKRIEDGAERTFTEGASNWPAPASWQPPSDTSLPREDGTTPAAAASVDATAKHRSNSASSGRAVDVALVDATGANRVVRPRFVEDEIESERAAASSSPSGTPHTRHAQDAIVPAPQRARVRSAAVVGLVLVSCVLAALWFTRSTSTPTTESLMRDYLARNAALGTIAFEVQLQTDAQQANVDPAKLAVAMPVVLAGMNERMQLLSVHWQKSEEERAEKTRDLVQQERAIEARVAAALKPLGSPFAENALDLWSGDSSAPVGFTPPKPLSAIQAQLQDRGLAWIRNTEPDRQANMVALMKRLQLPVAETQAVLAPMVKQRVDLLEKFAAAKTSEAPALLQQAAGVEAAALPAVAKLCGPPCDKATIAVLLGASFAGVDGPEEWRAQYEPLPSERGKE